MQRHRWSQKRLLEEVEKGGAHIDKTMLSRLLKDEDGEPRRRGADLQLRDALTLARALGVSPLALLEPGEHRVRLSDDATVEVSSKRFRDWTLGLMPLPGMDGALFTDSLPQSVSQLDEVHEVYALVSEAAFAAHDPDFNYAQVRAALDNLTSKVELVVAAIELRKRKADLAGYQFWQRTRRDSQEVDGG